MEKIIIDDVDVSKCKHFDSNSSCSDGMCLATGGTYGDGELCYDDCSEHNNCYYKQLQRMDKGYGELMEENARILAKLEKTEFENRKLKRENQELRDNYVKLDLIRVKEFNHMRDLFIKVSTELVKLQEELDPNIHLKTIDFKIGEENK